MLCQGDKGSLVLMLAPRKLTVATLELPKLKARRAVCHRVVYTLSAQSTIRKGARMSERHAWPDAAVVTWRGVVIVDQFDGIFCLCKSSV